jgi:hypothetical protein
MSSSEAGMARRMSFGVTWLGPLSRQHQRSYDGEIHPPTDGAAVECNSVPFCGLVNDREWQCPTVSRPVCDPNGLSKSRRHLRKGFGMTRSGERWITGARISSAKARSATRKTPTRTGELHTSGIVDLLLENRCDTRARGLQRSCRQTAANGDHPATCHVRCTTAACGPGPVLLREA